MKDMDLYAAKADIERLMDEINHWREENVGLREVIARLREKVELERTLREMEAQMPQQRSRLIYMLEEKCLLLEGRIATLEVLL